MIIFGKGDEPEVGEGGQAVAEEREVMDVDVLFVGGGVASLSGALHLSNLIKGHNKRADERGGKRIEEIMIAILEKGPYPGAHGISGAVMDPGPLRELVPDFEGKDAPLEGEVKKESIYFLTKNMKSPGAILTAAP